MVRNEPRPSYWWLWLVMLASVFTTLVGCSHSALPPTDRAEGMTNDLEAATETLKAYMTLEKARQWHQMWQLLHPDSQALWDNSEEEFAKYMEYMFRDAILQEFQLGRIELLPQWTFDSSGEFAGNDRTYFNVAEITVIEVCTISAIGDITFHIQMYAVKQNNSWRVMAGKRRL